MVSWCNYPKTCKLPKTLKTKISTMGIFHFKMKFWFFKTKGFDLKSSTSLWSWILQFLTNFLTFEHICESWFNFCIGIVLVKCQLRVKQRPCLTLKTKMEHDILTNWNKRWCWVRSKQLWKCITTTKSWINEKLQRDESIATSWWRDYNEQMKIMKTNLRQCKWCLNWWKHYNELKKMNYKQQDTRNENLKVVQTTNQCK
jgi:hypothetical protein